MKYQDRELICIECKQPFHFTASEQAFYAEQGYAPPKRCPSCRAERRQQRKQVRADHGPAEMSNYSGSEQNGRDVSAQAASEEPTKQPQAEAVSGASAPSVTSSQETSSGGAFKRFWRWITQPG